MNGILPNVDERRHLSRYQALVKIERVFDESEQIASESREASNVPSSVKNHSHGADMPFLNRQNLVWQR
jgi:hypothetical protein